VEARRPFVVVCADATPGDTQGKAIVYIARVKLGDPQGADTPTGQ